MRPLLLAAGAAAAVAVVTGLLVTSAARAPESGDGWGAPGWSDEFDGPALDAGWSVYDSPGHAGNGLRRPGQVTVADGVLTQTGTADALSAGMLRTDHADRTGRWEFRMRADQRDEGGAPYHLVLALIPVGVPYDEGERDVDFAEADLGEPGVWLFVHHPPRRQAYAMAELDMTAWHTYAVEIADDHLTWFVDGRPQVTLRETQVLPTTPLAANIQLDANVPAGLNPARLQVDWVRYHPLPAGGVPVPDAPEAPIGEYRP